MGHKSSFFNTVIEEQEHRQLWPPCEGCTWAPTTLEFREVWPHLC